MSDAPPDPSPTEAAFDAGMPIVDAHHHLYVRPTKRYMFEELLADVSGRHNVTSTVYIETCFMSRTDGPPALRPVGETEFANGVASMSASGQYGPARLCAGIVGHVDLTLGDGVEDVLLAHAEAGKGRFRGIRQGAYWDDDEAVFAHLTRRASKGLLLDPRFRRGFGRLAQHDMSFDAILFHHQIPELTELARAFPGTPIVLNHLGFPLGVGRYAADRDAVFAAWRRNVLALAGCGNVCVKLGGFGMSLMGFGFDQRPTPASPFELAAAWRPYFEVCIEAFGPSRCMFESNFPVDRVTCSYDTVWDAFKHIARPYSRDERAWLFSGTASDFYRLPVIGQE